MSLYDELPVFKASYDLLLNIFQFTANFSRAHKPSKEEQQTFLSSMNSYLGIMKHYKTYKMRKKMIYKNISGWWWNYVYLSGGIRKFEMKRKNYVG